MGTRTTSTNASLKLSNLSLENPVIWILALAMLSVGAKNFELGLSLDAPLYAHISRNMITTGEWLRMNAGVPDFQPFAEHPHLAFWIQALVFKLFGAADWSARILGHLSYVGFLFLIYKIVFTFHSRSAATLAVLLLWIWPTFSNFFSTFYLDGPFLFFAALGTWWLYQSDNPIKIFFAATLIAFAIMTKGLAIVGFAPILGFILVYKFFTPPQNAKRNSNFTALIASFFLGFSCPLIAYYLLIQGSSVPNFFELYWNRQMTSRFSASSSFFNLFSWLFWKRLFIDTHGLLVLLPLALIKIRKNTALVAPTILFISFVSIYSLKSRIGGQYWITVMPWIAWILATLAPQVSAFISTRVQRFTGTLAVALVLLIQYTPISTHHRLPTIESNTLLALKAHGIQNVLLRNHSDQLNFIRSAPIAWYSNLETLYSSTDQPLTRPQNNAQALLIFKPHTETTASSEHPNELGWCSIKHFQSTELWISCEVARNLVAKELR